MGKSPQADDSGSWAGYYAHRAGTSSNPALKGFYAAGLPPEDTPIAEAPLMALDFETTGLDPARHAIVSIGMVPFSLRAIRPGAGRYWVVRPQGPLREASIAFHRITHSEVEQAPLFEAILDEVLAGLAGHIAVVHYRHVERPFLDAAVMDACGERCLFPLIDTMTLEACQERPDRWRRLKRLLGIRAASIRLADSRARYGLPAYSSHHAKLDAMATAELLQAQIARHYSPHTPVSQLWG